MTRRTRLAGLLCLLAFLAGCVSVEFPSLRHDNANSGFVAEDTSLTPAKVAGMRRLFAAPLGVVGALLATPQWRTPVLADGKVFATGPGRLTAFDASGVQGCQGDPVVCEPLWTGAFPAIADNYIGPVIGNNTVFVTANANDGSGAGALFAFDLKGRQGCSGTPVICEPLWTADVHTLQPPLIANGKVYVINEGTARIEVFDATGQAGCSGAPLVCEPLWTAAPVGLFNDPPDRLALSAGSLFRLDGNGNLYAYDAAGVTNCSGAPAACQPLWSAAPYTGADRYALASPPVIADGRVFVVRPSRDPFDRRPELAAFDVLGQTNCSGTPKSCVPLWTTRQNDPRGWVSAGNGKVYVPSLTSMSVFDAAGAGCSGSPQTCPALFTYGTSGATIVANGLAMLVDANGIRAYDAAGSQNCAGSPTVCTPVAQAELVNPSAAPVSGFIVAKATVYVITVDSANNAELSAYR